MVITLEREVVNHTYSFYATSSRVHKSLIKAILTGSLYVKWAKAGVDFGIFVRAQVSILSKAGCKLLEIRCDEHDRLIGESQFVTHTVGSWVEMMVPLAMCMVSHSGVSGGASTEMSFIEKGIVALTLEDNVRSLVMVAAAYKHYSWYCKVHGEIEGELSDEANVVDPYKGVVSFESAVFEKRGRSIGAQKYKYRSIMFNTKDAKKPDFIRKLLI
ncbi:transcription elongation factor TFIIS-like protein [Tanacetum coccineum]